ncbi:Ribonuclease E [bacterium HR40]|nr:Ribonuclease E [bacterium HR40]
MTRRAVIEPGAFGPRAAILEEGRLLVCLEPPLPEGGISDRVFLARVVRVEPRMNAAFLDLGHGREAFLTAKDARLPGEGATALPLARRMREGEMVVVQGLREPDWDKRARVTTDLRLFGLFLVYRPHAPQSEASGRARGRLREELAERARRLFPEGGFVLRRFAAGVDDAQLLAEAEELRRRHQRLVALARSKRAPGPLDEADDPLDGVLRFVLEEGAEQLVVADAALASALRGRLARLPPALQPTIEKLPDGRDAFAETGVHTQIEEALSPLVPLPGGGRLVIEPTLACVAIDVDGAGRPALELDLEAAEEIGRQLRLRNLGGSIVVDFIDLTRPADRRRLEEALKRALRDDPAQAQVHPMSALGIVQISRARRGEPLAARWRRPCHCCGAPGREPSLEARIEQLYRELRQRRPGCHRVRAGGELEQRLRALRLAWLEGHVVMADATLAGDAFVVEEAG